MTEVLRVEGLRTTFHTKAGDVKAVDDVSFEIGPGRILGLVGESGSGKTVTGHSILGMIEHPGRIDGGRILFHGEDLVGRSEEYLRQVRGKRIAMIFQDPMMTLNPVLRIDTQIIEAILAHEKMDRAAARRRARDALGRVGIPAPEERLSSYPHEFSGGMRQRVAIAIALLHSPDLVIADEPTTALDVTIQAQILREVRNVCRERNCAMLWITHDLAVVAAMAQEICVMYAGKIVERGTTDDILERPRHPYTRGLIDSIPSRSTRGAPLRQIAGAMPSLIRLPGGCSFRPRCLRALDKCGSPLPAAAIVGKSLVRCIHPISYDQS